MKRIGTITTAVSLIFYGIWLTISNINYDLSVKILKWWPVLFIAFGIEMLYASKKEREQGEKKKVNYLIILVIFMFLFTNVYVHVKNSVNFYSKGKGNLQEKYKDYFKKGFDVNIGGLDLGENDSKEISANKSLSSYGKEIKLDLPNSKIKVKNSKNEKIILDLKVYVDKDRSIKKYEIHEEKAGNGYKINFPESYVNGVNGVIYVPKGLYVKINGSNLKVDGEEFIGDIDIDGSNCDINLYGDIKRSIIDISNGKVKLKNKVCKDIKIDGSNATVTVNTEDKDFKAEVEMNNGVCTFNGEKRVNSGFSKVVGNGSGKLNVDLSNGVINIKSGE